MDRLLPHPRNPRRYQHVDHPLPQLYQCLQRWWALNALALRIYSSVLNHNYIALAIFPLDPPIFLRAMA